MAFQYNDGTKLITTDDIIITGSAKELGDDLSTVLEQQSNDIAQLKSNVKWIAKHGGVGGGGSGSGGGGGIATSTKFNLRITYIDNNGISAVVTANQKTATIAPILCKLNKNIVISVTITSAMSTTTAYRATLDKGDGMPEVRQIYASTGVVTFSFTAEAIAYNCNITISGETTSSVEFSAFTQIIQNKIYLSSGTERFGNNASIDPVFKYGLRLNTTIENLIPGSFDLELDQVTINGQQIPDVELNQSIPIGEYFTSYGLYSVQVNFHAINKITGDPYDYSPNYIYVYKESNKVFVYCFTESNEFVIYNSDNQDPIVPIGTDLRNIPLTFRVYGTTDDNVNTAYEVLINGVQYKRTCKVETDYTYNLANTTLSDTYEKVEIKFSARDHDTYYYIYLKNPGELSYIFKREDGEKCYGAIGDNTDSLSRNGTVSFPDRILGEKFWVFSNEDDNQIVINSSCIPAGYLSTDLTGESRIESTNILNFISYDIHQSSSRMYDGILSIGINYLDSSYEKPVFVLQDSSQNQITFYRNCIRNGNSDAGKTDRFGMPDDGKFHLITIYFKQNYRITETSTKWGRGSQDENVTSFAVYIDGVLDVKPTPTNFTFTSNCKCIFTPGITQYNFFGAEIFNPVPYSITGNLESVYTSLIRKYVQDYDPFIVSNYYMCYANVHYKDLDENAPAPFEQEQLDAMTRAIYSSLISGSGNYVNYYNSNNNIFNKFVPINISAFSKLFKSSSTIPIFRIVPTWTDESSVVNGLHQSIKKTMESMNESTSDDAVKVGYSCKFQRYSLEDGVWEDIIPRFETTEIDSSGERITVIHDVNFRFKFQGSSTLLYSVKNFSISTDQFVDTDKNIIYTYYFNPDSNTFDYPETSFNLKADLVDSSSCTNNVMGNFINDYMTSPFNDSLHNDTLGNGYKSCLSGRPILLFINNNIADDSQSSSTNLDDLFLGIYNLNLNRGSVNNLGYQQLPENLPKNVSKNFDNIYCQVTTQNTNIVAPEGMSVAEVQGNGNVFDFSQFDYGLLNQIFGDFYAVTGGRVVESYSTPIQLISRDFAYYVRSKIINYNNEVNFPATDYGLETKISSGEIINYYEQLSSKYDGLLSYYRIDGQGVTLTNLSDPLLQLSNIIIINYDALDTGFASYKHLDPSNISIVGNADYQFHLLYNQTSRQPIVEGSQHFYYVEHAEVPYDETTNVQTFDLETSLKYYMTCMAFAMVDSVQKNMNIKRPNNGTVWYPQFYDMDTALALDNAGNNSNYKAFSDYVLKDGTIVSDYAGEDADAWFDTPSSYLFLFAKYEALLNRTDDDKYRHCTPIQYWLSLRGVPDKALGVKCEGVLRNANVFCERYLNNYLTEDIPPLVWNLNYFYKYFSETLNSGGLTGDTEESRFNGRMIYRRRTWLEQRLHYLDAMFGISNSRSIGYSGVLVSGAPKPPGNEDIEICNTMFPGFKKGITNATINITVKDQPRTPLILQSADSKFTLYITDNDGFANIKNQITSSTDIAFNGTKHLLTVSDCAPLLKHPSVNNNIVGDQIQEINVLSDCSNVVINLEHLPSLRRVNIGSQGSAIRIARNIQITGDGNTEFTLNLMNVICPEIELSSCVFSRSSKISNLNNTTTFKINSCVFQGETDISNCNFEKIILIGNRFSNNFTINSGISCILSVESNYFNNTSSIFKVNASKLTSISIKTSQIYNFQHSVSNSLETCSIELITGKNQAASIILNSDYASKQVPYTISTSNSNNKLTKMSISADSSYSYVTLRIPLFRTLTTLNLSGKFKLGKMSIAGCGLESIEFHKPADGGIIGFENNIDSAFAGYNGMFVFNDTDWQTLFSNVTSAVLCFSKRTVGLNFNNIKAIFNAIKSSGKSCNITGLFSRTNVTLIKNSEESTDAWNDLGKLEKIQKINEIADVYPTKATGKGSFVFHRTNFNYLTTSLAEKIVGTATNVTYDGLLGTSSSTVYIQSGALTNFAIVRNGVGNPGWNNTSNEDITTFHPIIRFIDLTVDGYEDHSNIIYSEEFSSASDLGLDIYTSSEVSFDYGENGMGRKITQYRGLFSKNASYGNILNIVNMFNNTNNLSSSKVSYDFQSFSIGITELNNPRIVDLYEFLVTGNSLNEKAYRILSSRNSNTESYALCGSFYKIISADNFRNLLELLRDSGKTDISSIFYNCTVTGVPSDDVLAETFFKNAFFNVLCKFQRLYCTFKNCKFLDVRGNKVAMVLDDAFGYTFPTNSGDTTITTHGKSGTTSGIQRAFEGCYIREFKSFDENQYGLGIAEGNVAYGIYAFNNCTFKKRNEYNRYLTQYSYSGIQQFPIPEDLTPILPERFLTFCKKNAPDVTNQMFGCSSYDPNHLTGYIPEDNYWFGPEITLNDTFYKCNVYYHKYYTDSTKTIEDENRWIIFPGWYTNSATGSSDRGPFNVYIPIPLTNRDDQGQETYYCSIFGYSSDIRLYSTYKTLPRFPDVPSNTTNSYHARILANGAPDAKIYLTQDDGSHELPAQGGNYVGILPTMLSPLVSLELTSTIVTGVKRLHTSAYMPINKTGQGLDDYYIFKGILKTTQETTQLGSVIQF